MPTVDPVKIKSKSKRYYENHRERLLEDQKKFRINRRLRVLKHYSGEVPVCACCQEAHYEFLGIDHIDGGGTQHRKSVGVNLDRWLIKNGFPEGYQVLCHNCNLSLGMYGHCPHKRD